MLTAAGDIASCGSSGDRATGNLVRAIDPTVALTLGDNVYPDGSRARFSNCYDPAWGSFKKKTRPSPGNHDYETTNAAGYFGYFGTRAGPCCRGYYKFDVGRVAALLAQLGAQHCYPGDLASTRLACPSA